MSPAKSETLDFTNVKERTFNTKHLPEGDYPAKVTKVESGKSKKSGNKMWVFTIGITDGRGKGASYPYYCTLDVDSLWKVRNLFAACGVNIPKKKLGIDPNKLVNRPLGITLEDDEYEGKPKSVISATIPLGEVSGPEDEAEDETEELEEEAPKAKAGKAGKADKGGKKGKKDKGGKKAKPAVDDDELEELEVEEL